MDEYVGVLLESDYFEHNCLGGLNSPKGEILIGWFFTLEKTLNSSTYSEFPDFSTYKITYVTSLKQFKSTKVLDNATFGTYDLHRVLDAIDFSLSPSANEIIGHWQSNAESVDSTDMPELQFCNPAFVEFDLVFIGSSEYKFMSKANKTDFIFMSTCFINLGNRANESEFLGNPSILTLKFESLSTERLEERKSEINNQGGAVGNDGVKVKGLSSTAPIFDRPLVTIATPCPDLWNQGAGFDLIIENGFAESYKSLSDSWMNFRNSHGRELLPKPRE